MTSRGRRASPQVWVRAALCSLLWRDFGQPLQSGAQIRSSEYDFPFNYCPEGIAFIFFFSFSCSVQGQGCEIQ